MTGRRASAEPLHGSGISWLPWWYRPSLFLIGVSIPGVLLFSFSDKTLTLSKAQLIYGHRDMIVALVGIFFLAVGARIGESGSLAASLQRLTGGTRRQLPARPGIRVAESFLSERFDWFLMAVFLVAHLIFFRAFIFNPGLAAAVLGGNVELKHSLKTIPGLTTWTQVSLLLGALRGLRWAGILPGKIKLISTFHLLFFGVLFVRAILWSERLALIEGVLPFVICALPRVAAALPRNRRFLMGLLPVIVPVMLLFVFTAFEFVRSWQYYSGQHSNVLVFGWRRLFTYYFEAMNTGAATVAVSGFYERLTMPLPFAEYESVYRGLYQGTLDKEYNNTSGMWYIATRIGNLFFVPFLLLIGAFVGATWRSFYRGQVFGLFFPISFLGLMEIIRIPYWIGTNRVVPATLVIVVVVVWAATVRSRVRLKSRSQSFVATS